MLPPGTRLRRRYRILERLGSGGLADTFLARDESAGEDVVVKAARDPEQGGELLRKEFDRLAGLDHPNLARVRDLERAHALTFYTADFVAGAPLAPARWREVRVVFADVVRALRYLHGAGLRHGDVKPENVLVTREGRAVLIDLSAASRIAEEIGEVSGTLEYLAPEIASGAKVDGRADLFSLGVSMRNVVRDPPDAIASLIERLLRPRAERPASAAEVLELLGASDAAETEVSVPPELLGRDAELARIRAVVRSCAEGAAHPLVLAFRGVAGSGKSRLLREFKWEASRELAVFEASHRAASPARDVLRRAADLDELGASTSALLDAIDRIGSSGRPTAIVVDDFSRLAAVERETIAGAVRSLEASAGVLFALVDLDEALPRTETIEVGPLDAKGARRWLALTGSAARLEEVEHRTGNLPGFLAGTTGGRAHAYDESEARALAMVALFEGALDPRAAVKLGLTSFALRSLEAGGVAIVANGRYRLRATDERAAVLSALDRGLVAAARTDALAALAEDESLRPLYAKLLAESGELDRAAEALASRSGSGWKEAARAIGAATEEESIRLEAARALIQAGDPAGALDLLEPVRASTERSIAMAEAELKLGRPADVRARLAGLVDPRAIDLAARAAIARGEYEPALESSTTALARDPDAPIAPRLLENVGLAAGYLGDVERAGGALASALAHHSVNGDTAGEIRTLSYRAIVAQRRGDFAAAAADYRRVLELADAGRLDDQIATASLNLGTAEQERGEWGSALEAYERSLRFAVFQRARGTEAVVRFNLANLYAEIGATERASAAHARAREIAAEAGLAHLALPLDRLAAEIALLRGERAEAAAALGAVRDRAVRAGAAREAVECALLRVEALPDRAAAEHELDRLAIDEADLALRARLLRARFDGAAGRSADAVRALEAIVADADGAKLVGLSAEARTALAALYDARGLADAAAAMRSEARRSWQRIAVTLPSSFKDSFEAHPRRRGAYAKAESAIAPATDLHARLQRFLAVNRKLGSTLSLRAVLEHAVDAAIELSAAERGFVLLSSKEGEGSFTVAAARNLDRERIPRSHLKFSRSIAENVVASDRPVVTVDAQQDERFARERSVHAMRLQSVACVPIRTADGVRGALYLDNRFERGRFDAADVELLQAFADQVAVAVVNAELHEALKERTRELETARRRLEDLVRGQAETIETLTREVQSKQQVLEYRFDYSQIIGRSAKMRAILSTLERVIDSSLSVLVAGESGTGKELVARAIHYNGPRRDKRLVSLNCAALPETLIESELFGHVRGAFTGADSDKTGLLAIADGGTVFLDELGEMPMTVQAKLLRALQEREIWPVGATSPRAIDIRLVCATNRDLKVEVERGRFREDLYYRIGVVRIELPPLRERMEDLPDLLAHFLPKGKRLGTSARRLLLSHRWPGNVRELENVLARAAVMAQGDEIGADDLDLHVSRAADLPIDRAGFEATETDRIFRALEATGWNVSRVSRELGIPRPTLYRKLQRYRLERPE
jgi:transcriptional regulator with GAF, ATPase, and Fis domain/tetratricopeptide (TPR) repeat protein